eukprot:gene3477-22407_t
MVIVVAEFKGKPFPARSSTAVKVGDVIVYNIKKTAEDTTECRCFPIIGGRLRRRCGLPASWRIIRRHQNVGSHLAPSWDIEAATTAGSDQELSSDDADFADRVRKFKCDVRRYCNETVHS